MIVVWNFPYGAGSSLLPLGRSVGAPLIISFIIFAHLRTFLKNLKLKTEPSCSAKDNGYDAEYCYDLDLCPATLFKVVMDRSHLEEALTVSKLEVCNQQHYGQHTGSGYATNSQLSSHSRHPPGIFS